MRKSGAQATVSGAFEGARAASLCFVYFFSTSFSLIRLFLIHVLVEVVMASSTPSSRFGNSSKEDRDKLLRDAVPASTRNATSYWITVFKDFCMASYIVCNLETVSEDELANALEHFFCSIRKKNREEYKRSGYIAARSAIQRHLDSLERKINLRNEKFVRCNPVIDVYLNEKKWMVEKKPCCTSLASVTRTRAV